MRSNFTPITGIDEKKSKKNILRKIGIISINIVVNIFVIVMSLILLIVLPIGGGLLNRVRGGWAHFHSGDGLVSHDGLSRFVFAGVTGVIVLVCTSFVVLYENVSHWIWNNLSKKSCARFWYILVMVIFGSILFTILTWLGLYVGWGVYFSIGRNADGYKSRAGVFDWLVGHDKAGSTFSDRWFTEFSGMSLRGLLWTLVPGLLFTSMGWGFEMAFSGVSMGLFYEIGHDLPIKVNNFTQGTPIAEFLWGYWIWFTLIISIFGGYHREGRMLSKFKIPKQWKSTYTYLGLVKFLLQFIYEIVSWAFIVFACILFIVSCISYGLVKQKDMRNKNQSWMGLLVQTIFLLIMFSCICCCSIVYILYRVLGCFWKGGDRVFVDEEIIPFFGTSTNLSIDDLEVYFRGEKKGNKMSRAIVGVEEEEEISRVQRKKRKKFFYTCNIFYFLCILLRWWNILMIITTFITTFVSFFV